MKPFHFYFNPLMNSLKDFILNNFKILVTIAAFFMTLYVQHQSNTVRIGELQSKCQSLELKIQDQYEKIDAIKLDKSVFEATMVQFTSIQTDLREMRADIKSLLQNRK